VADLRVEGAARLPLQQGADAAHVLVAQPGDQDGVQPVQVSAEVPEAGPGFGEAAVDQDVEAVDAEERRVALAAGEDVQGRVAEANIACEEDNYG